MAVISQRLIHRAIAIAFVIGSAACANDLTNPSAPTLSTTASAFDKKTASSAGARAFIDKLGNTFLEVSTTSAWDDHTVQPGQLTHVHFKLCKGWNKDG
ncbi:MAG: hypothetical protein M3Z17_09240, partial [Gemmatimonadota bacterium]|nr:hypothetical protein [Gemmatimonadota bacterium]